MFVSDLVILYNCASAVNIDAYSHAYSFSHVLTPYLLASDSSMRLHAKLTLAFVSSTLQEEEVQELMCLAPEDADSLLATLGEATSANDRKAGGFTVIELILALVELVVCHRNLELIAKVDILPSVVAALSCGSIQEQQATCQLLWSLLSQASFRAIAGGDEFPLLELLEPLQKSDDDSLQLLASCILFELKDTSIKGKLYIR